jgi:hypothetical protein
LHGEIEVPDFSSKDSAERERRIHRLTEGPPEFSHERIELPKQRP